MKKVSIIFLFLLSAHLIYSQAFMRPNEWKKYKREVFVTLGTANFLGDLGGRPGKGTDYRPVDLNFNQSRSAFGFGARYKLKRAVNVAAKFSYLNVKGDDAMTYDPYRDIIN